MFQKAGLLRVRAWALLALAAFAGCDGDPVTPDPGPARARIEMHVLGPADDPVAGALVNISVYLGPSCDAEEVLASAEAVMDQAGQSLILIEAEPEAAGRVNCTEASIVPPPGSSLQGVELSFGRLLLANAAYVPDPPLARYFVSLEGSTNTSSPAALRYRGP